MAVLENPRYEKFAQYLALGMSQVRAYVKAGYSPGRKGGRSAADAASRLLSGNVSISRRADELKRRAAEKVEVTLAGLTQDLLDDRFSARVHKNDSAAIRATLGVAEMHGYLTDKRRNDREPLQGVSEAEALEEADRIQKELLAESRERSKAKA